MKAGLTREEVATAAGIAENYFGSVERGEATPSAETLGALAAALKVKPAVSAITSTGQCRTEPGPGE